MLLPALILIVACAGADAAGWPSDDASSAWLFEDDDASRLKGYDIDRVVDATTGAMTAAARDYYLPDGPENAKPIARYAKDARSLLRMQTDFRRALARVCVDLARTARDASSPAVRMTPVLETEPTLPDYEEGVSSISVTSVATPDGDVTAEFTNTMPCINAAGQALHRSTLAQFPETGKDPAAKSAYGRGFAQVMTADRLFNHVLAEVCSKLVHVARDEAGRGRKKKPGGR